MRSGERRAIASVITELERLSSAAPALLQALQPYLGRALVVGFTGPPGAGKSTLVNAVIANVRPRAAPSASSPSTHRAPSPAAPSSATASA